MYLVPNYAAKIAGVAIISQYRKNTRLQDYG